MLFYTIDLICVLLCKFVRNQERNPINLIIKRSVQDLPVGQVRLVCHA